jgi:hypothetical protein
MFGRLGSSQLPLQDWQVNVDLPGLTAWRSFDVIGFELLAFPYRKEQRALFFYQYEIERRIFFCPCRADS